MEAWSKATPSSPYLKARPKPASKADNFLQKLFIRELCGKFKSGVETKEPKVRPFTRLPGRLAFCLKDVVPLSALEAGHVFLGFSKCGQFLLSYTQTPAENLDLSSDCWRIPYHFRYQSSSVPSSLPLLSSSLCTYFQTALVAFHALQKGQKGG